MKAECDRLQKELLVAKEELAAAREVYVSFRHRFGESKLSRSEPKVIIADIEPDHEDNARVAALQVRLVYVPYHCSFVERKV